MLDIYKGSNGLLVNNKVVLIIETKKIINNFNFLFDIAEKYGIDKSQCKVIENNPTPDKHHLCHAYAAYSQSGFDDASILIIDGMDQMGGKSIGIYEAKNGKIKEIKTYPMTYSLGSFYSYSVTLCGFQNADHAGKMMGASSYSSDVRDFLPFFLVDKDSGEITESNLKVIPSGNICKFIGKDFLKRMTGLDYEKKQSKFDFTNVLTASTAQRIFEQSVFSLLDFMHNKLPSRNLIISGGCALNCVCNGKIIRSGKWNDLFIPNMCEDQGNIVGRMVMEYNQKIDGPFIYNKITYDIPKEYNKIISKKELANKIKNGQIVAWFEGGSEYGPRALCHRSILANPELHWMAYRVNEIKHREYWRPLAPVVLDTHFKEIFDVDGRIWYPHKVMLATEYIRDKYQRKYQSICAPDNSSRPQVLSDIKENHTLYSLMSKYDLPILMNTSMNDAGEAICETPEDAIRFCNKNADVMLVFVKNDKIYTNTTSKGYSHE